MKATIKEIFDTCKENGRLLEVVGSDNETIVDVGSFTDCGPGFLVCAPNQGAVKQALDQKASAIVTSPDLFEKFKGSAGESTLISCKLPDLAQAIIKQEYVDRDYRATGWPDVHPSAVIHESVKIPKGTIVGPNTIIEAGVTMGQDCMFMGNVVLEHDAQLGDRVTIQPSSIVGWGCVIGNDVLILPNSVIGSEGFGYAQDEKRKHHRIPQTGNVIIGDRVTVGACNTIDRGTYGPTVIGNGSIYDNICHTAHNVEIGEDCIMLSGFLCAGSTIIGDRVIFSGQTMLKDHVNIGSDTVFLHRAGIIKDITEPGAYCGSPTLPMKTYMKSTAIHGKLDELKKQVQDLEARVSGS